MDPKRRALYNAAYSDAVFQRFLGRLERELGPIPFQVAETPLILTHALRDLLGKNAREIVEQLSDPGRLAELKRAIPPHYNVPGMDELPNCVQVDFAITQARDGQLEGQLVELQAFPSLYALMTMFADSWAEELDQMPGLAGGWSCFMERGKPAAMDLMKRAILGSNAPEEVVLVDLAPETQKTSSDFVATQKLFGVDPVCVTQLEVEGRKLFRRKEGKRLQVHRIYNRMVFDELEVKKARVPFQWNDPLEVSWCSHPNWYWVWSKLALPYLDHPAVPRARFLSQIETIPSDLSGYVLKPLFSFAGAGVVIDVTREAIDAVPGDQRDKWVLQEKITYADAIRMPDGNGVKAEVRIMLLRPPGEKALVPVIPLVRLSRGKMLGVDFNKGLTWVGGSVGMWPAEA